MRKFFILLVSMIFVISCQTEPVDKVPEETTGKIPKINFSIPDSLKSNESTNSRTVSTDQTSDQGGVFEPFRQSLVFADVGINIVNDLIDSINKTNIPEQFDVTDESQRVVVTTDTSREYNKKIEFYTLENVQTFEINYNEGIKKGYAIFNVTDSTNDLKMVKLVYDGTDMANETLDGFLTFKDPTDDKVKAKSLYFNGVKKGDVVDLTGGVVYNYKFGDGDADIPDVYKAYHAYMFTSISNVTEGKSLVNLYFPKVSVTGMDLTNYSIDKSFSTIVFDWVTLPGNTAFKGDLGSLGIRTDSAENLTADLMTFIDTYPEENGLDLFKFLLNLSNPIAYNTNGFVANGIDVEKSYTDLGDLTKLVFTMSPKELFELKIEF